MQDLHFTLRCRGCGRTFAPSLEPPRSARDPITLYCRHCGCPNQVAPADGVLRDRWSAANSPPTTSEATSEATADAHLGSGLEPFSNERDARSSAPRSAACTTARSPR